MDCSKRSYETQHEAENHLIWIRNNGDSKKVPNGTYQCPRCAKWHLTSNAGDPIQQPRKQILDRYLDIPFREYLEDASFASNSMLKLVGRSPAHLRAYLDNPESRKPSDALIVGRAAHAMVLETDSFNKYYYSIPDDLKKLTKPQLDAIERGEPSQKALELHDKWQAIEARAHNRELIRESQIENVKKMRDALLEVKDIRNLLSIGSAEQTRYFVDSDTGVKCKMRADFVHGYSQTVQVDYKTTDDARPKAFTRSIINYGYDFQAAHYKIGGEAEYFYIIAQEKAPPYAAKLYLMTSDWLARGEALRRKYLEKYADCLSTNEWPSYATEIETLEIPRWAQIGE